MDDQHGTKLVNLDTKLDNFLHELMTLRDEIVELKKRQAQTDKK